MFLFSKQQNTVFKNKNLFQIFQKTLKNFQTSTSTDYYSILGVPSNSSAQDIKIAYYKKAQQFHPDKSSDPQAKEKFSEINNAYEILKDDNKRNDYDNQTKQQSSYYQNSYNPYNNYQQNYNSQKTQSTNGGDFYDFVYTQSKRSGSHNYDYEFYTESEKFDFEDLFAEFYTSKKQSKKAKKNKQNQNYGYKDFFEDDFFEETFSSAQEKKQKKPQKGDDLNANIEISFMESIEGVTKPIKLKKKILCKACKGKKKDANSGYTKCKNCNGKGVKSYQEGFIIYEFSCTTCKGKGQVIHSKCKPCKGSGIIQEQILENIQIPKGVTNGQTIKFNSRGNINSIGGQPGNLNLKIKVKSDKQFQKDGNNLNSEEFIDLKTAVLGGTATFKTIKGDQDVTIKPGMNGGREVKLEGFGVQKNHQSQQVGDHIIKLKLKIPNNITKQQKELIEKFHQIEMEKQYKEQRQQA